MTNAERIAEREKQPLDVIRQVGPWGLCWLSSRAAGLHPAAPWSAWRHGPNPRPAGEIIDMLGLRKNRLSA